MHDEQGLVLERANLSDYILTVAVSCQGEIGAISAQGEMLLMDTAKKTQLKKTITCEAVNVAAIHPDSQRAALGLLNGKVILADMKSGEVVCSYTLSKGLIDAVSFSADGNYWAAISGKKLMVWYLVYGNEVIQYINPEGSFIEMVWSADHKLYVAGYKAVKKFDPAHTEPILTLGYLGSLHSIAVSPKQDSIVCGTQNNGIHFWEVPYRPESNSEMNGYPGKVKHLVWNSAGTLLASNCAHQIVVWPVRNGKAPVGKQPRVLKGHVDKVTALAFIPNIDILCSGDAAGNVAFWMPSRNQPIVSMEILPVKAEVSCINCTADGLVVGTSDGHVYWLEYPI